MLIRVQNSSSRVISATEEEKDWLSSYLSFTTKVQGKLKTHSLFNSFNESFPAGLTQAAAVEAKNAGQRMRLVDERTEPCAYDRHAVLDWLRGYQQEAVGITRLVSRGIFHHGTGAGKSEVIIGITETHSCKWLILVHRKDLMHQLAARYAKRTGELVGILGDGEEKLRGNITIAMMQTLNQLRKKPKWAKWLREQKGLIVDECHVAGAGSYYRLLQACTGAYYRYGFSGTPFARGDKKNVYVWGALGPVIHTMRAPDLIAQGVLAIPRVRLLPVVQLIKAKSWQDVYRLGIVESKERNKVVIKAALRAAKPCLLFVQHIEHGKALLRDLEGKSVPAEFVWGTHKTPIRRAAIRRLVHGDTDVLICNVIFQEGVDIPELQSVVMASGGKSVIAALQSVGRGLRKRATTGEIIKEEVEIYDFLDRGNVWLQKHARSRMRTYAREKYPVVIDRGGGHVARVTARERPADRG